MTLSDEKIEKMEDALYKNIMNKYDEICKSYEPNVTLTNDGVGCFAHGDVIEYDKGETYVESIENEYLTIIADVSFIENNLNHFCECILEELSSRNTFEKTYYNESDDQEITYTMNTKLEIIVNMVYGKEKGFTKSLTLSIYIY